MPAHRTVLLVACTLAAGCASGPSRRGERSVEIPAGQDAAYDTYRYAPAVRVGDTVYVSGIPAAPGDDYDTRVRNMFESLRTTLAHAGASLDDVVEITTFHREPRDTPAFDAEFARFLAIHKAYFTHTVPAWTAVGTTALLADGAPVEMRAVAVVGSGRNVTVHRAGPAAK